VELGVRHARQSVAINSGGGRARRNPADDDAVLAGHERGPNIVGVLGTRRD